MIKYRIHNYCDNINIHKYYKYYNPVYRSLLTNLLLLIYLIIL